MWLASETQLMRGRSQSGAMYIGAGAMEHGVYVDTYICFRANCSVELMMQNHK